MEENLDENLEGNKEQSYYGTKGKKVVDTLIGFFAGVAVNLVLGGIISGFFGTNIAIVICVIAYIFGIFIFIRKGRKYIAVGLILMIVIPLLVFGGCLLVTGGKF